MKEASDRSEALNTRALRAASGLEAQPEVAIAELLSSDVPIFPNTRMELAGLFERREGVRAKIIGNAATRRHVEKLDALQVKLRIGRTLRGLIEGGMTREQAREQLQEMGNTPRGASSSYADKAIIYADRVDAWLKNLSALPHQFGETPEQWQLQNERLFHRMEAMGAPLDR